MPKNTAPNAIDSREKKGAPEYPDQFHAPPKKRVVKIVTTRSTALTSRPRNRVVGRRWTWTTVSPRSWVIVGM